MIYDELAVDLLLANDHAGLRRLAAKASRSMAGKGHPCRRCGNESFQLGDQCDRLPGDDPSRECDNCGLGEGDDPPDESEALSNDAEDGL